MFLYNLRLALLSLRRDPVLTALMIGAVAVGIGMSTTTLAVFHAMSGNPIAYKNDQLYPVQLDNWSPHQPYDEPHEPPTQVTYRDATALIKAAKAQHQVAMFETSMTLESDKPDVKPDLIDVRATYGDFFTMFDAPFQYGGPW